MLQEKRCEKCGTLLYKESIEVGEIEVKCYRCNTINYFAYSSKILDSLFTAVMT